MIFVALPVFGQTSAEERAKNFLDAGNYRRALIEYRKAYAKDTNSLSVLRGIITSIVNDENPREAAIPYCERYVKLCPDDASVYYDYAVACFHGNKFVEARRYLNEYISLVRSDKEMKKADKLQRNIDNAQRLMKSPLAATFVNMGPMINTEYCEINPYITDDDKTVIFSSDDKYNSVEQINYFNIKYSEHDGLQWQKSKAVGGLVNTLYDEYISGLSHDKTMFFCHNRSVLFQLASARYMGRGRFSDGEDLGVPIDQKGDEVAACLTQSGDTMIFSGTSTGGYLDLYYSIRLQNGKWGEPRPLPGKVNEADADQSYPMLDLGGRRLYFASNGSTSMGGYDLYYSELDMTSDEWSWGEPVQLPYPINDAYDNMTISFSSNHRYGYMSCVRPDGFGGRDIYQLVSENVASTMAIFRYEILIRSRPKITKPATVPLVQIYNADGVLQDPVTVRMPSATFIVALAPGTYTMTIDSDGTRQYKEKIVIDEIVHLAEPVERKAVLIPLEPQPAK